MLSYKPGITLPAGRQGFKIFFIFFIELKKGTLPIMRGLL
jgi:hypothetical protein